MKTAILYGSPKKLTKAHQPIHCWGGVHGKLKNGGHAQPHYFVRMKVIEGSNLLDALERAKPRPGETVLNTVEIP